MDLSLSISSLRENSRPSPISSDESFLSETPLARSEFLALKRETDPELRDEGLLALGRRLENQGQAEAAAALFHQLSIGSGPTQARAFAAHEALQGRGSLGARSEILLRHFVEQVSDPAALLGMTVAGSVFRGARFAALAHFRGLGFGGTFARGAAALSGLAVEAPAFVFSAKIGSSILGRHPDWNPRLVSRELAGAYLTLLGLRGFGALSQATLRGLPLSLRSSAALHLASNQGGMLGGILLAHSLESELGLRPRSDFGNSLFDGLSALLHFNVAGRLNRVAFGEGLASWERRLDSQSESLARNFPEGPFASWSENFQSGLVPMAATATTRLPAPPLFNEPMQMAGNDNIGRGDRPSQSGSRPSFSAEPRPFPEADAILQGVDFPLTGIRAFLGTLPVPATAAKINPDGSMRIIAASGSFVREFSLSEAQLGSQPFADFLRLGAAPVNPSRLWNMLRGGVFKASIVTVQGPGRSQRAWISGVVRKIYGQDYAFTFFEPLGESLERTLVHPALKAFQNVDGIRRLAPDSLGFYELRSTLELSLQLSNSESFLVQNLRRGDLHLRVLDSEAWPLRDFSLPLERVLSHWGKTLTIPAGRNFYVEQTTRQGQGDASIQLTLGPVGFSPSNAALRDPAPPALSERVLGAADRAKRHLTPPPRVRGLFEEVQQSLRNISPWPNNKDPKKPSEE